MEKIEEAKGGVTPQALANKPKISSGIPQEMVFSYNVLASRRTSGMAPNPIQLSEILSFVELFGKPSISIDVFVELIGVMDTKYLELVSGNSPTSNR